MESKIDRLGFAENQRSKNQNQEIGIEKNQSKTTNEKKNIEELDLKTKTPNNVSF